VGIPVAGLAADTMAVNVIAWPTTVGLVELVTVVELASLFTVWVIEVAKLALKFASPPYDTVMVCSPSVRLEGEKLAEPPDKFTALMLAS
jgi:hypothetical protein